MANETITQDDYKITIKGRIFDLSQTFPFTVKDWKNVERKNVTIKALADNSSGRMTEAFVFSYIVLNKADPSYKEEEFENLTMMEAQKVVGIVLEVMNRNAKQEELDNPL